MSRFLRPAIVDTDRFRATMSRLAAGVSIVASTDGEGNPHGLTATAVCSVSLDPPLVLACLSKGSATESVVGDTGRFALNFLGRGDEALARRFAEPRPDKFEGVQWTAGATGAPLLGGALATCECRTERVVEAGDHTVFIGRVEQVAVDASAANEPLIYFAGSYAALSPPRRR